MSVVAHTGYLLRLYWAQERSQFQWLLFNAVMLPGTMCYLGLRVAGDSPSEQLWWIAGAITMGLGMSAVSQTGFAILNDRFTGRFGIVRSSPIPKLAYYIAQVSLAVGEGVAIVVFGLLLFHLLGLARLTLPAVGAALLAAVCASSALGGLGAVLATRAPDFPRGGNAVGITSLGLTFISPVLWDASGLPLAVRALTWLSPFTHAAALVRATLAGSALPAGALVGSVVMGVALNVASYRFVRWQE